MCLIAKCLTLEHKSVIKKENQPHLFISYQWYLVRLYIHDECYIFLIPTRTWTCVFKSPVLLLSVRWVEYHFLSHDMSAPAAFVPLHCHVMVIHGLILLNLCYVWPRWYWHADMLAVSVFTPWNSVTCSTPRGRHFSLFTNAGGAAAALWHRMTNSSSILIPARIFISGTQRSYSLSCHHCPTALNGGKPWPNV